MSWSGVKKHTNNAEIKAWCEEMSIKNYTINDKGEIDVNGNVDLSYKDIEELPYKFGEINGYFDIDYCKKLISLKNCPHKVVGYFSCDECVKINLLEMCPREVGGDFFCRHCKQKFTKEKILSLCKIGRCVYL